MEVRALEDGFYGGSRRRKGSTFQWNDAKLAKWVAPVADKAADAAAAPVEQEPETLSEINRKEAKSRSKIDKALSGE